MKLSDNSELTGHGAVRIPEVDAEPLHIQHPVVHASGSQVEQIFSEKPVGDSLAMVFSHVVKGIPHFFVDRRDIGPDMVDSRCSTTAGNGI